MEWKRTATGGWTAEDGGGRWSIRGPIMGKSMFWLYLNNTRFCPTGKYESAVSFPTVKLAQQYAENYAALIPK